MLSKVLNKISAIYARRSSEAYCKYLKNKGIQIGEGTYIYPQNALVDFSRPSLVKIGSNCFMNQHFTLLTHDWVTKVWFIR